MAYVIVAWPALKVADILLSFITWVVVSVSWCIFPIQFPVLAELRTTLPLESHPGEFC